MFHILAYIGVFLLRPPFSITGLWCRSKFAQEAWRCQLIKGGDRSSRSLREPPSTNYLAIYSYTLQRSLVILKVATKRNTLAIHVVKVEMILKWSIQMCSLSHQFSAAYLQFFTCCSTSPALMAARWRRKSFNRDSSAKDKLLRPDELNCVTDCVSWLSKS